jgi:hypothetical protein
VLDAGGGARFPKGSAGIGRSPRAPFGARAVGDGSTELRSIVGHDPLDGNAEAGEPGKRPLEEGHGALLALVGEDFGAGEPGGVVDADMQELPADAARPAGAVAGEAMAEALDPAALLDVPPPPSADGGPFGHGSSALRSMDAFARPLALVPDRPGLGVEGGQPVQAASAQGQAHGGDRPAEPSGDRWARQALASQRHDLGLRRPVQPGRAAPRPGRPVGQAGLALGGKPALPLAYGRGIDTERRRLDRPTGSETLRHCPSTARRVLGVLVDVHPVAPGRRCVRGSHNVPARTRVDNLHSNDS